MSEAGPGHTERVMWLRLARTEGLGAVGFARLIARYATAEAALDALPGRYRKAGKPAPVIPSREMIEAELDAVDRVGGVMLTKIYCWTLSQYKRVLYLDSDVFPTQSMDAYFELETCLVDVFFVYRAELMTLGVGGFPQVRLFSNGGSGFFVHRGVPK